MSNTSNNPWGAEFQNIGSENEAIAQEGMAFGNVDINEYNPATFEAIQTSIFEDDEAVLGLEELKSKKQRPLYFDLINNYYNDFTTNKELIAILGGEVSSVNTIYPTILQNTAALRLSHALNQANVAIPNIKGITLIASNALNYIYQNTDMIDFLRMQWGKEDLILQNTPEKCIEDELQGKQGVLVIMVNNFTNQFAHITLFNGYNQEFVGKLNYQLTNYIISFESEEQNSEVAGILFWDLL